MKRIIIINKKFFLALQLIFLFNCQGILFGMVTNDTISERRERVNWFEFEWIGNSEYYNFNLDKAHMIVEVRFENLHETYPMEFRLTGRENFMFTKTRRSMVWHYPAAEQLIEARQSAGRTRIEHFPEIAMILGEERVRFGITSFRVVPDPPRAAQTELISKTYGAISGNIFHDKVLFIDLEGQRMAFDNEIPWSFMSKGEFVDFELILGYITITVNINERDYNFWVLGEFQPAVEIYNKRLYGRIISSNQVTDSLLVYNELNQSELVAGNEPAYGVYLGDKNLKRLNYYYVEKSKTRFNRRRIIGTLPLSIFSEYIIVIDYKNQKFGIVPRDN